MSQPRRPGGYRPATGSNPPAPPTMDNPWIMKSSTPPGSNPSALGSFRTAPVFHPMPPMDNPYIMKSSTASYGYSILRGLTAGRKIYISGYPKPSARQFWINLVYTMPTSRDIAFHFNPRFSPENCVVRNSQFHWNWGREERTANYFPFSPGVKFDMVIKVEPSRFMVEVNGVHFTEFIHRLLPIESITSLQIEEDVVLTNVRIA